MFTLQKLYCVYMYTQYNNYTDTRKYHELDTKYIHESKGKMTLCISNK